MPILGVVEEKNTAFCSIGCKEIEGIRSFRSALINAKNAGEAELFDNRTERDAGNGGLFPIVECRRRKTKMRKIMRDVTASLQ